MNALMNKMKASGSIKESALLSDSILFNEKDSVPTEIPIINLALSGKLKEGLVSGLTFLAGPSKHFKSLLGLMMVKAYMDQYPESICLFFDSEFGITPDYIRANGLDASRILHIPILHIEQLKFDMVKRINDILRKEKVIIFIDSIGNLASKKEVDDAEKENEAADMTRAKALKSLWRIITPHLTIRDIPLIAVNHTYQTQEMYAKSIMSGGQGGMLSAMQVFFIGKAQEKDGTDIVGWNFTINIEKSRFVREKSKFTFQVNYGKGINKWSGLLDLALESGHVIKPKRGWYQTVNMETGEVSEKSFRESATNNAEFWTPILACKKFNNYVESKFLVSSGDMIETDDVNDVYDDIEEEGDE
jgi:RecA/RadA recombinase